MLEYGFQILPKFIFDSELFHKELQKIISHLTPCEIEKMKTWLQRNFENEYAKSCLVS
ncbi:MAG: hypothetical protein R6U95_09115 [Bacteroidales bacterium]